MFTVGEIILEFSCSIGKKRFALVESNQILNKNSLGKGKKKD
jgi:hypothetical protein